MNSKGLSGLRIAFLIATSLAPLFAFSPFIIGMVGSSGMSSCNESNCEWATLGWLGIITIPLGIMLYVAGLIGSLIAFIVRPKKGIPLSPGDKVFRQYTYSFIPTALAPLFIVLYFSGISPDFGFVAMNLVNMAGFWATLWLCPVILGLIQLAQLLMKRAQR